MPESPIWLISRKRENAAKKSLQWLRGWVSEKEIQTEFETAKKNQEFSSACAPCQKAQEKCTHPSPSFKERMMEFKRKQTLKPFAILFLANAMAQVAGMMHLLPFVVQLLKSYQSSIKSEDGIIIISASSVIATLTIMFTVKFIGKRRLYLISLAGCFLSHLSLCAYGYYRFPQGLKSFGDIPVEPEKSSLFPLFAFVSLRFFTSFVYTIPSMMLG